jgi:hypothetical protein
MVIVTIPKEWVPGREDSEKPVTETHAFWSDDKVQDNYFVDVCYRKLLGNLRGRQVYSSGPYSLLP